MDDWELDLAGLPGRTENVGAGEGLDGAGITGEAFISDGDAVVVGVGRGVVVAEGVDAGINVEIVGWLRVGCGPV